MSYNEWKSRTAPFLRRAPVYYRHELAAQATLRRHTTPWTDAELLWLPTPQGSRGHSYTTTPDGKIDLVHAPGQPPLDLTGVALNVTGRMMLAIAQGYPAMVRRGLA